MSSTCMHGCAQTSSRGTIVKGGIVGSQCGFLRAYAMTFGRLPSWQLGYRISHLGEATPPRTSIPCRAVSFLAVPMVSNQGSWISSKWVLLALFSRAWVAAFRLRIFTDAMSKGGCPAINSRGRWQRPVGGTRESTLGCGGLPGRAFARGHLGYPLPFQWRNWGWAGTWTRHLNGARSWL